MVTIVQLIMAEHVFTILNDQTTWVPWPPWQVWQLWSKGDLWRQQYKRNSLEQSALKTFDFDSWSIFLTASYHKYSGVSGAVWYMIIEYSIHFQTKRCNSLIRSSLRAAVAKLLHSEIRTKETIFKQLQPHNPLDLFPRWKSTSQTWRWFDSHWYTPTCELANFKGCWKLVISKTMTN